MSKLIIFFTLLLFVSCNNNSYTSARIHNIEADRWGVQDTISQIVSIQDTSKLYQVSIFVTTTFEEVNAINILSSICYQKMHSETDTINVYMSSDLPKTLMARERKNSFVVMDSVKFNSIGEYRFNFLPTEELKISALGVYIYERDGTKR